MKGYYKEKLAGERLLQCYDIAPPRVQQYLQAEVDHIRQFISPSDKVLELGCGYGRILPSISRLARVVVGIDNARESLLLGQEYLQSYSNTILLEMDALHLRFLDNTFDILLCIQNGISAFHSNPADLIRESLRVTRKGGVLLFSTYSEKFWLHRMEWFRLQAAEGLLGEIDEEQTKEGRIVCKDGFTASTITPEGFELLAKELNISYTVTEVDESCLFFGIVK